MKTFWLALSSAFISMPLFGQLSFDVPQLTNTVTIDGAIVGNEWNDASVAQSFNTTPVSGSASGISGNFRLKWDATNVYALFQITDDVRFSDSGGTGPDPLDTFNDDSVELFFDVNNSNTGILAVANQNYQYRFAVDGTAGVANSSEIETGPILGSLLTGVSFAHTGSTSYNLEVLVPWGTLGYSPTLNDTLGFDVALNDDDNGGARDSQLFWNAVNVSAFNDASQWGDITLTAAIPEPSTVTLFMGIAGIGAWLIVRRRKQGQPANSTLA